jgi:anti-anti-sigma factor
MRTAKVVEESRNVTFMTNVMASIDQRMQSMNNGNSIPAINVKISDRVASLQLVGCVLHGEDSASAVLTAIEECCARGSALVIDLNEVTKMDAAGIGALAAGCAAARKAAISYRVENAHGVTLEQLNLTGLSRVLLSKTVATSEIVRNVSRSLVVHSKKHETHKETNGDFITAREYGILQRAYTHFQCLFPKTLPPVLITLQRHRGAYGFFLADSFRRRNTGAKRVHEIALNPDGFVRRTDKEVLSTLVHEMAHVYQHEYRHEIGQPGRRGYHNRRFAQIMFGVGLMPSNTGKPGGAITGESMSHYILEGGAFDRACSEFLGKYGLTWESAVDVKVPPQRGDDADVGTEDEGSEGDAIGTSTRPQKRTKFTCPICGLNAWAKPSALLVCHECTEETGETILMLDCKQTVMARAAQRTRRSGRGMLKQVDSEESVAFVRIPLVADWMDSSA